MIENKDGNLSSETPLLIENITLPDGVTPDERVQYKIGREVFKLIGAGLGCPFFVFYDENRGWRTNPVSSIEEDEEKIVLKDNLSVYTFKKISTLTD
ncbi:hypothetical protein CVD28_03920 [Bacillus sp. M6-12]|uniref:hypothetical protein n=1 Tax=Bacillus sp. M6-12 TaxID=2054166 RepID=UPI000C788CD5|nr:hypothetical protein [Bacillus sp. M6-12]PLS19575.1 hypothetical protein CVD28_03920 [Bacillus sp. M6-12]